MSIDCFYGELVKECQKMELSMTRSKSRSRFWGLALVCMPRLIKGVDGRLSVGRAAEGPTAIVRAAAAVVMAVESAFERAMLDVEIPVDSLR
jgi:hypothetical protein